MPNLHAAKVTVNGVRRTMRLCTKCLRRIKAEMAKKSLKVEETSPPAAQGSTLPGLSG